MPKTQLTSTALRNPNGVFSQATAIEATGRLVFVSGMTARKPDGTIAGVGDISEQTRQVCENVQAAVREAGGTLDDVCRVDVYVRNMEDFAKIHAVRAQYFAEPLPASTMVEVSKLAHPDYLIEISAIAVIP
ncbi:reactive intermediate/imine deaminase [Kribbella sp. VKM Ac-2527]|uniref:Reactive intermediate/imine deaminase n=1 Tax=Kribbella caucasensis TaxID=2512215 RepID=A0A4R6KJL4_9ACTN|nr:RidA family protein [Kribbella sp. VKM Ac-2527]TDO50121.1 reactive intermediate/imine deaminase [Kribbella sp. VKM Ac-2527]